VVTSLVIRAPDWEACVVSRRHRTRAEAREDLHDLGLPQYSSLTIEGRIERAGMAAEHLARSRRGQEKPVWRSGWGIGLHLILLALVACIALSVLTSYL
jgi:hypothetical protein